MTHQEFEKLVSDWIDEPGNADAANAVAHAVAADPGLARVRDQLLALDGALRAGGTCTARVDWDRFRRRVMDAVHEHAPHDADAKEAARIDAELRASTDLPAAVDWSRLQGAIVRRVRKIRRRRVPVVWRAAYSVAAVAAAGLLAVLVPWTRFGSGAPVAGAGAAWPAPDGGGTVGRVLAGIVAPHGDARPAPWVPGATHPAARVSASVTVLEGERLPPRAAGPQSQSPAAESRGSQPRTGPALVSFVLIDEPGEAVPDGLGG